MQVYQEEVFSDIIIFVRYLGISIYCYVVLQQEVVIEGYCLNVYKIIIIIFKVGVWISQDFDNGVVGVSDQVSQVISVGIVCYEVQDIYCIIIWIDGSYSRIIFKGYFIYVYGVVNDFYCIIV